MIYTLRSGRYFFKGMSTDDDDLPFALRKPLYVFGWGSSKKFWSQKEAKFQSNYISAMHNEETQVESFFETVKRSHVCLLDYWIAVKTALKDVFC